MRRRSPLMQAAATGAALALAVPLAVRAESSADRASRTLNFEVRRDRARDEALDARAADNARSTPATSPGARQIDEAAPPSVRTSAGRRCSAERPSRCAGRATTPT